VAKLKRTCLFCQVLDTRLLPTLNQLIVELLAYYPRLKFVYYPHKRHFTVTVLEARLLPTPGFSSITHTFGQRRPRNSSITHIYPGLHHQSLNSSITHIWYRLLPTPGSRLLPTLAPIRVRQQRQFEYDHPMTSLISHFIA